MTDATRLSEAMERRRLELRMKWTQVAERADLSQAGLGAIRRGERSPSPLTKARIEHAFEWTPGSVDAIQAGGEPTPAGGGESQAVLELLAEHRNLTDSLAELDSIGAKNTAAYKILAEELEQITVRLRQVDRRGHRLDETGS